MNESLTLRRLVVPTDFSEQATAAMPYAALLAKRFDAQVTLLHASAVQPSYEPIPLDAAAVVHISDGEDQLAVRALEETRSAHFDAVDVRVRNVFGRAAEAILDESHATDADMIVMGTHGRGGVARALLGSVAEDVIRESDRPVLTVRTSAMTPRIARILCPINYSNAAANALQHAMLFASAFDAELLALYFKEDGSTDEDLEMEIERLRLWIGDIPLSIHLTCLAHHGEAAVQVNEYARSHQADLVVVGAQQRRGALKTTIGSTTDRLTRHAPCPVLTVPAGTVLIADHAREDAMAAGRSA